MLLVTCEDCGNQIKPPSLLAHKLKTCKILRKENDYELNLDDDNVSYKIILLKKKLNNFDKQYLVVNKNSSENST